MIKQSTKSIPLSGLLNDSATPIIDQFGRSFDYLRLSLNEQCNLRCVYCMPEEGIDFRGKVQLLTHDEICRLIEIVSKMGVSKIRFTGGEPLLRKDLFSLIRSAKEQKEIQSVHLTTNGMLLDKQISRLIDAGLTGINISLDTLNPDKFKTITRRTGLDNVLSGLNRAIQSNELEVKVNVVAMRYFNDNELMDFIHLTKDNNITVRFIELMPFDSHQIWKTGKFYGADHIVSHLEKQLGELKNVAGSPTEHHVFRIDGYKGKVAVIPAYSRSLCGECNRLRITSDGKLLNCLYSRDETNLRDAIRNGETDNKISEMIRKSMKKKYKDGWEAQHQGNDNRESMTQIGG